MSALTALQVSWVTAWALSDHGLVATLIAVMVGVLVVFAFWKAGALWPHARYGEHSVRRTG